MPGLPPPHPPRPSRARVTPRKIIGRLGIEPCAPNAYPSPGINAGVSRRFLMNVPVESTFGIGLLLDGLQEMLPDAGFSPAIEAARHGTPRPKALGQIPPGGTPTQYPQDATDDASMVQRRSSGLRFLRRKQRFDPLPLRVGQFFSFHIDECTRPVRVCKHALVFSAATAP